MKFHLSVSDVSNAKNNCYYRKLVSVDSPDAMKKAVKFDHLCGEFRDGRRSKSNFIKSDVIVMDCDNDHSDDPVEWITEEKLDGMLTDVCYVIVPSRNNMRDKGGKSARPRFHVYFPIEEISNADDYAALKRAIQKKYDFFDGNALDAARFIFGADSGEVTWHDGGKKITEMIESQDGGAAECDGPVKNGENEKMQDIDNRQIDGSDCIEEGRRNTTLHRFALKVLTRYGLGDEAYQLFMKEKDKCAPPLEKSEINSIWNSACRYYEDEIQNQPDYIPPDAYNDGSGGKSLRPDDYTDIGQAKALVDKFGDKIKYSDATDFLFYDGKRWKEDKQAVIGVTEEFLDLQLEEARDTVEAANDRLFKSGVSGEIANLGKKAFKWLNAEQTECYLKLMDEEKYLNFVLKRRDYRYVISALDAAKPMVEIDVNDLDKNGYLLNTPDGTYDLSKGMAGKQPHDPKDLITKITKCSPGNKGEQIWMAALDTFFCQDADLIDYAQFIAGMTAIGVVKREEIIISYGDGANGKSTFWNTLSMVLQDYSGKLSGDIFTVGFRGNAQPEMAELRGKRLVIATELEEGRHLDMGVVKQLCSTDEIYAAKKYRQPYSFTPTSHIIWNVNHLPSIKSTDTGTWRRIIVIPFNAKIKKGSDIKNYAEYLVENCGEAILKWIIEGAQRVIAAGFTIELPQCVKNAIQEYRDENDWLQHFLEECCDVDNSLSAPSGELYQEYRDYCEKTGEYCRNKADFYAAIKRKGFVKRKTNKGAFINGLQLKRLSYTKPSVEGIPDTDEPQTSKDPTDIYEYMESHDSSK